MGVLGLEMAPEVLRLAKGECNLDVSASKLASHPLPEAGDDELLRIGRLDVLKRLEKRTRELRSMLGR